MTLSLSSVCDSIYAATAIATLSKDCKTPLLHADHSRALRKMVRDSVVAIAATLPPGLVDDVSFDDNSVTISLSDPRRDTPLAIAAFETAATSLTLANIKIAASDSPDTVTRLASLLPSVSEAVASAITPKPRTARIRSSIF